MGKYLQTNNREALEETYGQMALKIVPEKPYPTLAGIQTTLDELAARFSREVGEYLSDDEYASLQRALIPLRGIK